jgi:UDP-glucose 4-epimerase
VYGEAGADPLPETAPTRPLTAYGADKLGGEQHARVAWTVHGVPTAGLRLFNIYGAGQNPASPYAGVIALFLERLRRGEPVTVFGDGRQTRDFVHVGDVVRALLAAMDEPRGARLFNVCSGRATSILDLARLTGELLGRTARIEFAAARRGDVGLSCGDPRLAARALGFVATTGLREGLALTAGDHSDTP